MTSLHALTLPDGFTGQTVALGAVNKVDGALVLLAVVGRPGFNRWARLTDVCAICGRPVADHLPAEGDPS